MEIGLDQKSEVHFNEALRCLEFCDSTDYWVKEKQVFCLANLACLKFNGGKYPEAIQAYTEVLKIEEKDVESLYERGRANALIKNFEAASADFEAAVQHSP